LLKDGQLLQVAHAPRNGFWIEKPKSGQNGSCYLTKFKNLADKSPVLIAKPVIIRHNLPLNTQAVP
jgi:hypothetical protein